MTQAPKRVEDFIQESGLTRNQRLGGSLLLAGGIIFILFNTLAEAIYPNYSVGKNALSDLGALCQKTALLWDGQLFVTGVLSLLGMYQVFRKSVLVPADTRVRLLYLLPPMGSILVSLFPENSVPAIHFIGAFMVFTIGPISAIYACKFTSIIGHTFACDTSVRGRWFASRFLVEWSVSWSTR